jgi:hypothetical protein
MKITKLPFTLYPSFTSDRHSFPFTFRLQPTAQSSLICASLHRIPSDLSANQPFRWFPSAASLNPVAILEVGTGITLVLATQPPSHTQHQTQMVLMAIRPILEVAGTGITSIWLKVS